MSITKRMQLQVLVVFLGLFMLTAAAFIELGKIEKSANHISDNTLPSITILEEASRSFLEQRNAVLMHVINNDIAKSAAIKSDYDSALNKTNELLKSYETYLSDAEDKALLESFKGGVGAVSVIYNDILKKSELGDKEGAQNLIAETREKYLAVNQISKKHIAFNTESAKKSRSVLRATEESVRKEVIGIGLVIFIIISIISWRTYKQVIGSLKTASENIASITDNLDFTLRCEIRHNDEIGMMLAGINGMIDKVQNSMQTIIRSSEEVFSAATGLATSASQVAVGSSVQSQSAAAMAAALEEITVSINHVADRTHEADSLARSTGSQAKQGEEVILNTASSIGGIAESVSSVSSHMLELNSQTTSINSVISVIRDVADQTNLLALNAAIEAARAGEMGRGFAVVADEVRKLAERTATSTQEIAGMITAMQNKSDIASAGMSDAVTCVNAGVSEAQHARIAVQEIAKVAAQSEILVGDIANAIREQGAAANSIAQQVESVAQMAEENSSVAAQVSSHANRLNDLAMALGNEVKMYRV